MITFEVKGFDDDQRIELEDMGEVESVNEETLHVTVLDDDEAALLSDYLNEQGLENKMIGG